MKNRAVLRLIFFHMLYALVLFGCTSFRVAGDIQKGRAQLMYGDPKVALAHFQNVAQLQPDYVLDYAIPQLDQSIWTYVGRTHYAGGQFPEARQALDRARSRYEHDYLAKIYLGLVLGRDGDQKQGLKELEAGLTGLVNWLDYIELNVNEGRFWDPAREIRSAIDGELKMIATGKVDWESITQGAEWIGFKTEVEIDLVRRDIRNDRERDSDGDSDGFN
jgi:tetratricopeptide (TPR) repeat protein